MNLNNFIFFALYLGVVFFGTSFHPSFAQDQVPAEIKSIKLKAGKLAMAIYMLGADSRSKEEWRESLKKMKAIGVQVVALGQVAWKDLEKSPGNYDWGYLKTAIDVLEEEHLDMEVAADIGMFINPDLDGKIKLPKDLEGRAFDDPALIERLALLYQKFMEHFGTRVTYLFLHSENSGPYFQKHPEDIPKYAKLIKEVFDYIRGMYPHVRAGVCLQNHEKPHWPKDLIAALNQDTDVVSLVSFAPLHFKRENDITATRQEFEEVLRTAGTKSLALHETTFQSSPAAGSSPERQAAFVRELFGLLKDHHNKIELMTWAEFSDLEHQTSQMVAKTLAKATGFGSNKQWIEYMTGFVESGGLFTANREDKPAAKEWINQAAAYYAKRSQGRS